MKNNKYKLVMVSFVLVTVSFAANSHAAPARTGTSNNKPINAPSRSAPRDESTSYVPSANSVGRSDDLWNEKLFYLLGGIDLGMSIYSPFNSVTEGTRSGFHGGLRVLGAFYFKKWIIDAGLGWHLISNSGTNTDGSKWSVNTKGSYLELSPRYRINQAWSIGPIMDYWFTTDNGLNPNALSAIPTNTSIWLGAQLFYEWMSDSWKFRLGGRWETVLNVTGRTANMFQLNFQFGIPLFGRNETDEEQPVKRNAEQLNENDVRAAQFVEPMPTPEATPWPTIAPEATPWPTPEVMFTPEPTPVLKHKAQEKFVVTLDVNRLPFETGSARLPRYHADRLREIGRFLAEHPKDWRGLSVTGHTDERGSDKYNNNLSKARADTVRQLLLEGGAPAKKIKAIGYGERKPKDKRHNEKAWFKNRRVDFEFQGVKDVVIINDGVTINPEKPQ